MKKQLRFLLGLTFFFVMAAWIAYSFYLAKALRKKHTLFFGHAYECVAPGVNHTNSVTIHFSFILNGETHTGSSAFLKEEISFEDCKHLVGHTFPMVYEPGRPSNATILLTYDGFERYGYAFPDSLRWTLQYVKERSR